ncbi:hypothetical protein NDU88_011063 [Pleurodeles waltl]|uniref:Uncharacterized protein n=1 Tax=Pleurodeles waltl TaxID=8319 RepID=A0AAV7Q0I0_PLEWA|nr:hypothetical protein NDU88_011063 [Pleurodeles waltl]
MLRDRHALAIKTRDRCVRACCGVVWSRNVKCHGLRAFVGGSLHARRALLNGTASSLRHCCAPLSAVLPVSRGACWARAAFLGSVPFPGLGSRWADPRSVGGETGRAPPRVVGVGGQPGSQIGPQRL